MNQDKGIKSLLGGILLLYVIVFMVNFVGFMGMHHFGVASMPHNQTHLSLVFSLCFAFISCICFYSLEKDEGEKS